MPPESPASPHPLRPPRAPRDVADAAEGATLHAYLSLVWRRRAVVGLTALCAAGSALLLSLLLPSTYEASSEFFINADTPRVSPYQPDATVAAPLAAPLVLQEVEKWYSGLLESAAVRERVVALARARGVAPDAVDAPGLRGAVDVQFNRKHIVRVRVRDADPARAALLANAYPTALADFVRDAASQGETERAARLTAILGRLLGELLDAHRRRETLLAGKVAADLRDEMTGLAARRNALETQIADSEGRLKGIEARLAEGQSLLAGETRAGAAGSGAAWGSAVARLQRELADIDTDLAAARAEFNGDKADLHPRVRALAARQKAKREQLRRESEVVKGSGIRAAESWEEVLRRETGGLRQERGALGAELTVRRAALQEVQGRIAGLAGLRAREQTGSAEITRIERMIDSVAVQQRALQYGNDARPLVVVQSAAVPVRPAWPLPLFNLLVGFLLGVGAGIYAAFAVDYAARVQRRRSVRPVRVGA